MQRRDFLHHSVHVCGALAGMSLLGSTGCREKSGSSSAANPTGTSGGGTGGGGPLRLAAVSPALAITLRDLGLADSIVGRHAWDMVVDLKVPIVGDQATLDYEALLGTKPTHVLLEWGVRPVPERLTELAEKHDWRVKSWSLLSYQQVRASFGEIAAFVAQGRPEAEAATLAARAVELTERLDGACAPRPMAARAGTVLLLNSVAPPAALGPGSFHQEILERLGGRAATTSGGAYIQMHMEDILRLAPESIVLIEPRDPRGGGGGGAAAGTDVGTNDWPTMERKLGAIAKLQIPAIRERRVALIDDPLCLTPSSAMIGFAEKLGAILERWATARQG